MFKALFISIVFILLQELQNSDGETHHVTRAHTRSPIHKVFGLRHNGRLGSDSIDRMARVFFPAFFVVFNIIYWVFYTQPIVHTMQ